MKKIIVLIAVLFLFSNAMAQDCNHPEAERYLSSAKRLRQAVASVADWQMVADEYAKALQYLPSCPDIYYDLGICYEELGKEQPELFDKANGYYRKYLQLNPNATDKNEVEGLIYANERMKEMYKKQKDERLAEEKKLKEEQELEKFLGCWIVEGWESQNVCHYMIRLINGRLQITINPRGWVDIGTIIPNNTVDGSLENSALTFNYFSIQPDNEGKYNDYPEKWTTGSMYMDSHHNIYIKLELVSDNRVQVNRTWGDSKNYNSRSKAYIGTTKGGFLLRNYLVKVN